MQGENTFQFKATVNPQIYNIVEYDIKKKMGMWCRGEAIGRVGFNVITNIRSVLLINNLNGQL